jgi:hypothetical protein
MCVCVCERERADMWTKEREKRAAKHLHAIVPLMS